MKYYIVGAGCGDPGLITVKGMELLQKADVLIYAGSLVNPELVAMSPAALKLDSWGMKLEEITSVISENVRAGKLVVRLHSGDPAIYGSIVEQIAPLEEDGIFAEIVPGVSSMFGAAAALQTEYTLRGVSESVIVTRSAGETLDSDQLAELSEHETTMVIFSFLSVTSIFYLHASSYDSIMEEKKDNINQKYEECDCNNREKEQREDHNRIEDKRALSFNQGVYQFKCRYQG